MQVDYIARFYSYVRKSDGCWDWIGGKKQAGYGNFRYHEKVCAAHRWHWEQINGAIPEGMTLQHTCFNRACVRIEHLEMMSHGENAKIKKGHRCPRCNFHF